MNDKESSNPNISRRRFVRDASLATAALCVVSGTAVAALGLEEQRRGRAPGKLSLWADRPAQVWMTDAYPIGNGPTGAMLFGGTEIERIQFNEISLWSGVRMAVDGLGDEGQDLGAYQAFGDVLIHLGHDFDKVTNYRRVLDIDRAVHEVTYEFNGVRYRRTAFASHADRVIVIHLTADKPGAYTGRVQLADMHEAVISAKGHKLTSVGKLPNGFEYEAQLAILHKGGAIAAKDGGTYGKNPWNLAVPATTMAFERCDGLTLFLGAGTNFLQDYSKQWLGEHPHDAITGKVDAATKLSVEKLQARHEKDHQALFRRFTLDLGTTAQELRAKTTEARLEAYVKSKTVDPELEALFCQFGRYLLIGCSRPGSLPANLQGVWNDSNQPAWAGDYHSNINVEMNYWPAEPANLAECHRPFIDYVSSIREVSAKNTQRKFGKIRGWTVQTMNNACGVSFWKWNPPGSAWYAQHLWEHFAFGRDRAYLRKTAYPVLKEACQFWDDHLKRRPDGTLVTPNGWSPEHGPERKASPTTR